MTNVKQICCKDAREPVYEEGIVQDVEVVVEGAQLETLEKQRNKGLGAFQLLLECFNRFNLNHQAALVRFFCWSNLNHLVRAAFPRKPLVVQWFLVNRADQYLVSKFAKNNLEN